MKVRHLLIHTVLCLLIVPVIVSPDVFSLERYDYDRIRNDYSDYYCPMPQKDGASSQELCPLDKTLTLKTALSLALGNNPDTQIAASRIAQSKAMLGQSRAAFMPSVNLYTEYTRADAPSAFLFKSLDQREFNTPMNQFNNPGIVNNFETGITAQMSLFNGGRNMLNRAMAKEDLTMSTWSSEEAKNNVAAQLINAWYDTLSASEFVKIAEESKATVKNQLAIMTVRFEGGSALKSDILSLKVRLAQAEEDLLKSKNRYKLATAGLTTILGVFPDKTVVIDTAPFSLAGIPQTYENGMATAMEKRPELHKVRAMVKKSRMGMDMAKSAYLPAASLMGKYYMDDPDMRYSQNRDNWAVGVMLNWNLFSGFSDHAGTVKSNAQLREALSSDRKAMLAVSFDVKNAYIRYEEAKARIDVAQSSVQMSEESLSLVKKQYEGGSATITRYLEAELDRNAAKIRATSAFYDREKALADIARSTGLLAQPDALISHATEETKP
jgi:outer membrane protein